MSSSDELKKAEVGSHNEQQSLNFTHLGSWIFNAKTVLVGKGTEHGAFTAWPGECLRTGSSIFWDYIPFFMQLCV